MEHALFFTLFSVILIMSIEAFSVHLMGIIFNVPDWYTRMRDFLLKTPLGWATVIFILIICVILDQSKR